MSTKLSDANYRIAEQVIAATAAVAHLNDQGAIVLSVQIGGRKPLIKIDGPRGRFMRGTMRSRTSLSDGKRRIIQCALVHGCQVEWTEIYAAPAMVGP